MKTAMLPRRCFAAHFESVDEVNAQLGLDQQVRKLTDTWLVVGTNGLDSLGYIDLITAVEGKCEGRFSPIRFPFQMVATDGGSG